MGSAVQPTGAVSGVTLNPRGVVLAEIDGQTCDMNQGGRRGVDYLQESVLDGNEVTCGTLPEGVGRLLFPSSAGLASMGGHSI